MIAPYRAPPRQQPAAGRAPERPREPAIDPAAEIAPAFLPRRESRAYCAPPEGRWAWLAPQVKASTLVRRTEVDVCRSEGKSGSTRETAFTIQVKEMLYPGGPNDVAPVDGKWVYVFRDQKLAVEAKAVKPGVWEGRTIQGLKRRPWRSDAGVVVDPGKKGGRAAYSFFLSPVKLTDAAIRHLEQGGALSLAAVECLCDGFGKTVHAPDPLRWAADAHARYYQPRLRTLQWWQYDQAVVAYAFVASVLKSWIDGGNQADVADELDRKPEDWLEKRKAGLEEALKKAEEAAAYVAHCVDSPEYFAVEQSGRDRGGEDLELCAVAMAAITEGLCATEPGKKLAQQLVSNRERLPAYFIFHDDRPRLADEWFERFRFGEKAFFGIFDDLLPASIQLAKKRGDAIRAAETQRGSIQRYLRNLSVKTELKKPTRAILENLKAGVQISAGAARGTKGWKKIQNEWQRLVSLEQVRRGVPTQLELAGETASVRLKGWEPVLKGLKATAGSAVELANVLCAYGAYRDAAQGERRDKAWAIVGAVSDLVEHGGGLVDDLLRECLPKMVARGAAGLFGFIGGAIDMVEYEGQLVEALGEYDYGKAVGRGMQVAGAAAGAAGGGMILAGAIYGSALGPAGTVVGIIGGVLVAAGFAVAAWLALNTNETFANRCFLGRNGDGDGEPVPWSGRRLPSPDATREASCLLELLAQFRLSCWADLGDWRVTIQPGYLEEASRFELNVHSKWARPKGIPEGPVDDLWSQRYRLIVDLEDDTVRQLSGIPLKKASRIQRDADGRVESISVNLEDAQTPEERKGDYGGTYRAFRATTVQARLLLDGKADRTVPYNDPGEKPAAVQIVLPTSERIVSFDKSKRMPFEGNQ